MRGRECGGEERMAEAVDLPVAMEPVRAISNIFRLDLLFRKGNGGRTWGGVRRGESCGGFS